MGMRCAVCARKSLGGLVCDQCGCSLPPPADRSLAALLDQIRLLLPWYESIHAEHRVGLPFDPERLFLDQSPSTAAQGTLPPDLDQPPRFAAPEVAARRADLVGPATDVFHLALLSYLWLADFWPQGLPGEGPARFAYRFPPLRIYVPEVPEGVAEVLEQGLRENPAERWPDPTTFFVALQEAADRAEARRRSQPSVRWEIAAHSRVGRGKQLLNRENEDRVLVCAFRKPPRALLAVADGISLCDVGSGALASLLAVTLLENTFTEADHAADFREKMPDFCKRTSRLLLDWALEKGYRSQLRQGADLMGTTLTAAWLEGRHLQLANAGDSRAYLVTDRRVEQLTVDGDLGTTMLAAGMPPESLADLGPMGKALTRCLGGCTLDPQGDIVLPEEGYRPALSSWPLLPGDVVVLCTDGLVDEGMFLEPQALADIVRAEQETPVDRLACLLADRAEALHRPPSPQDPEGLGDNISVVVVRVLVGDAPASA